MSKKFKSKLLLTALCTGVALSFVSVGSFASTNQNDESPVTRAELLDLMQELRLQKERLDRKEKELDKQKKFLDYKMSELDETLGKAEVLLGNYRGTGSPPVKIQGQETAYSIEFDPAQNSETLLAMRARGTQEVGTERKSESQKKPEVPAIAVDEGGVLLPKGKAVLEPSIQYSRTSALRVAIEGFTVIPAINVGLFDISEIDRDIVTTAVTGRLGLTNRLELEAYVPYLWREDSTIGRPIGVGTATDTLSTVDGSGLGDLELALHYQINDGKDGWPYFIGNFRYKSNTGEGPFDVPVNASTGLQTETPTGSGFHAFQPSVTMLYPTDPAVFFANAGYTYNMKEDLGGTTGEIDPGDSINTGFGMGFSINDRTSFSLGYSHSVVFETTQNGNDLSNSDILQVGSTSLGFSYQLNDRVGINFNVGTGITDDAPDMQATLRVPVKFDLF
nr:hypothetical protein [Cytophagales bacterium]